MSKLIFSQKRFQGISDYLKENPTPDAYYFGHAIDYRNDPQSIQLLPGAVKESGSVVTDLLKWGDITPSLLTSYYYGNVGNIYSRTAAGSWSYLHTAAGSHGNGLAYFNGDDYLYYTTDTAIGRYGTISSASPQFTDNFLQAQGGVPQNTASLLLASASSQYATAADSASLSQTGNITLETFFKANTLPTVGNSMTLIGKWDESGTLRSYKLDLFGVSGYFGDGSNSSLTISTNTTDAPIDSACSGTSGTQTLTATNVSFAAGQVVLIHQTQGTGAGSWMRNIIQSYTAGTITLSLPLNTTYGTGAQVIVMKQYTNVTINTGVTYTAKAWNGTVGGILTFLASGTVTVTGTLSATGKGYRGATNSGGSGADGIQGEGYNGVGSSNFNPNANGGGGGQQGKGGGGGGLGTSGGTAAGLNAGIGGSTAGSSDLTTLILGGGGGSSAEPTGGGNGGAGGGVVFISGTTLTITGSVVSLGNVGTDGSSGSAGTFGGGGGGGAGGAILLKAQTATLGANLVTATGASGGSPSGIATAGATGGDGLIHLDYYTSYTGTTTPTLDFAQDNTLVTTTTTQARLSISANGTSFENLTQNLPTLTTGAWNRLSVSWVASTSTATFYLNAVSLGMSVGTRTAIHDNASLLYVGANKNATVVTNFFDGLLNDMRIWGNAQTVAQIYANNLVQLTGSEGGLVAYYKFNSAYTDGTANANNLTAVNSPVFSTDVPFPAPSTRLDIDQSYTVTGNDYDLLTSISEASVDKLTFTPTKDPQKSVDFNINAKGTGNWTVTVHDMQNNVIATQTITNANLAVGGYQEFIFSTPWRITIGRTYHMHLTSTVNDGSVVSSADDDFSTGDFHTYYSFLVTDSLFHPIIPFLNFLAIGNERYIATWDGASYNANNIALPIGWHVRCFSFWREYLAVGMWRGQSVTAFDEGRVYFWDGISATFNFFIDVPEGQINAMVGKDSDLYMFIGYRGILMDYQGGYFYNTGNSKSNKIKKLPKINRSDVIEVYPGAMSFWKDLLHFGVAVNTTSSTLDRGVYAWGSLNVNYPDSLL